jgi:hypothetical protein
MPASQQASRPASQQASQQASKPASKPASQPFKFRTSWPQRTALLAVLKNISQNSYNTNQGLKTNTLKNT